MTRAVTNSVVQFADATGLTHEIADQVLDIVYRHVVREQAEGDLGSLLKQQLAGAGIDRSDDAWDTLALGAACVLGVGESAWPPAR